MSVPPSHYYIVYTSGDEGSMELLDMFFQKKLSVERRDIRDQNSHGSLHNLIALRSVVRDNKVPHMFLPDGAHIGGFEEAMAYLNRPLLTHQLAKRW